MRLETKIRKGEEHFLFSKLAIFGVLRKKKKSHVDKKGTGKFFSCKGFVRIVFLKNGSTNQFVDVDSSRMASEPEIPRG
jgi:hypothetical protein